MFTLKKIVFIIISIIILLSYCIFSFYNYSENKNYLLNTTIAHHIQLVHTYKKRIDEKLLYQKKLIKATSVLISKKDPLLDAVFIKEVLHTAISSGGFNSVYIGYNNNLVISGLPNWEQIETYKGTERPWYQAALNSSDVIVTQPYIDSVLETNIISIAVPIFHNNKLHAVLASDLEFSEVQKDISSLFPVDSGFAFLMTDDAKVLLNSNIFGIDFSSFEMQEFLKKFAQEKSGHKKFHINNEPYIFVFDSLDNSNWLFVSVLNEKKIYEQLNKKILNDFIGVVIFIFFGIGAFIFFIFLQNKLFKNRHLLELFAKSSIGGVLMTDKNGHIILVNKSYEKIFSIQFKSLYGKHINDVTNDYNVNNYNHQNRLFFNEVKKNPFQMISFKILSNGLWYQVQVTPLLKQNKEFQGILVTVYDITHEEELESQRQQQEQILIQNSKMAALGDMISAISHQWRQPLSTMLLIISDMEDMLNISNKIIDYNRLFSHFIRFRESIGLMNETITIFRNFFKEDFCEKNFNLIDILEDVLYIFKPQAQMNGIEVRFSYRKNEMSLIGYPTYLKQVLLNCIVNAKDELVKIKKNNYTFDAYIAISVEENETEYKIIIEDNGNGISPEIAEKIFDPFFSTKGEDGTGTGLYICKLLFEKKMRGSFDLKHLSFPTQFAITLLK